MGKTDGALLSTKTREREATNTKRTKQNEVPVPTKTRESTNTIMKKTKQV